MTKPILTTDHPTVQCIDLEATFKKYRLVMDPAYETLSRSEKKRERAWLTIVECRYGQVYPDGGTGLRVETNGSHIIANKIERLPFVEYVVVCDEGIQAWFDFEHWTEVMKIMKPRNRRRLTEAQKQQVTDRLSAWRGKKGAA